MFATTRERLRWDLATESIVVKIRWFGIVMGYVLVQTRTGLHNPSAVRALSGPRGRLCPRSIWPSIGWGRVFLKRWPVFVALMESIFIALLCYHDTGLSSPFRWYYLLSLICCAHSIPADDCLAHPRHSRLEFVDAGLGPGDQAGRRVGLAAHPGHHGLGDLGEQLLSPRS